MSQIVKRRSTPQTRAGQYMCPQCGKVFDTKVEVDSHIRKSHKPKIKSVHDNLNGLYTE
ncbi:MAG: C2H2-type zinc finger protein [Candidatus Bathyarchaeia archaeon]